jgi:hypothetical protein
VVVIKVRKVADGYVAEATPPHVRATWQTGEPMGKEALARRLTEEGAHMQDAWDAVLEADVQNP